jgi:glycosyltransferase involved in cell wall biosynthesis
MRIVYVSRSFGLSSWDNIKTYVFHVTRCQAMAGHEVYLVTDISAQLEEPVVPPGITLVPVEAASSDRNYFGTVHEYADRVYATLKNLSHSIDLDVIEFADHGAEGFLTIRAKKLLNEFASTRLVVKLHGPTSLLSEKSGESFSRFEHSIQAYAEEYCIKNADLVVSPSKALADYCKTEMEVLSIPISPFPLTSWRQTEQRIFTDEQIRKVIFFGSLHPRKGVDFFIQAAQLILEQNPDFVFEIYGQDTPSDPFGNSYQAYLRRSVPADLRDKIRFCGGVPSEQLPDVFASACFCILPSRWENYPYACLEAMSAGCVVIGSKHGGMAEIIEDGISGLLVDPYQVEEIAEAVMGSYLHPDFLQSMSDQARLTVQEKCAPENVSQKLAESYSMPLASQPWISDGKNLKVSVIIPLYNQGQYLLEAIRSVKASTYQNIEIVVINDCSTDPETNEIFESMEGIVKVRQPYNRGLPATRNLGIANSTGHFIMPLDSDDKIHPLYIEKAVNALVNNPEIAYVTCYAANFGLFESVHLPMGYVPELMAFMNTNGRPNDMFLKEALVAVGGYDVNLISYEDWDLFISLHEKGFIGDVLPLEVHYYRRHQASMVYQITNKKRSEVIQYLIRKHWTLFSQHSQAMILHLVHLWKSHYEANESVRAAQKKLDAQKKLEAQEKLELHKKLEAHEKLEAQKKLEAQEKSQAKSSLPL